jgi:hypothetical protein
MVQNERRVVAWAVHGRNTLEHRFNIEHQHGENNALVAKHNELARKWNYKILGGQPVGRPLAASEAQIALRDAGTSLRTIAEETSLGLNTVHTILTRSAALAEWLEGARCRCVAAYWPLVGKVRRQRLIACRTLGRRQSSSSGRSARSTHCHSGRSAWSKEARLDHGGDITEASGLAVCADPLLT